MQLTESGSHVGRLFIPCLRLHVSHFNRVHCFGFGLPDMGSPCEGVVLSISASATTTVKMEKSKSLSCQSVGELIPASSWS